MKQLLFIIIVTITLQISAQHNFIVKNNNLKWQLVVNDTTTISSKNIYLKHQGFTTTTADGVIEFEKQFTLDDLKPFGYSWSSYPTYMQPGYYNGIIEFKDGKYRITITNINVFYQPTNTHDNLGDFVVKKSSINAKKHHLKALQTFNDYFTELLTTTKVSDW